MLQVFKQLKVQYPDTILIICDQGKVFSFHDDAKVIAMLTGIQLHSHFCGRFVGNIRIDQDCKQMIIDAMIKAGNKIAVAEHYLPI